MNKDYTRGLLGRSDRDHLSIVSRNATLDTKKYDKLVQDAKDMGFDTSKLIKFDQACGEFKL
eukprot:CAMPEP_0176455236 /NCGR_PEP_ID=MMETSP0127-20121128/30489_1 /TAXON_ID=938130 /ORGANISM="Platyophrya macrostoma, Strain WH" /LENGTH=61 /DNA_ID=CAMNT_0017844799 /DNA_START=29 /DNA_END=214 /DNA_ORIENTATION=-